MAAEHRASHGMLLAVTSKSWRMDCGVAGYDNRSGLPPFFPTRLRFEDYIYRLWVQQAGLASAHVDAAQNHTRNNYMRNALAMEVCCYYKDKKPLPQTRVKNKRLQTHRQDASLLPSTGLQYGY